MTKTILVLAANPKNTPVLRLDQEIREIENGLERAQKRDAFILRSKLAVRPVDVRRAMLDYRPSIVHFCGHGSGEEGIAFEDEDGQAKLISADALAGFFELFADKVECVVLNACYSEVQAEAIALYIPCVIGMKKAIGDSAAIEFAVAFYDALGAGESFEFAHKLACNAMAWGDRPEHTTPAIITKAKNQKEIAVVPNEHRLRALIRAKNEVQHYAKRYSDVKVFANHPKTAPTEYLIRFCVPSLAPPPNEESDPVPVDCHEVYFWFPPNFPLVGPEVFWQTPIFHPSIDPNTGKVHLGVLQDDYVPGLSLGHLCLALRELASFHNYPMDGPNSEAVKWLSSPTGQRAIVEMGGRRLHERINTESRDFAPRMYELK